MLSLIFFRLAAVSDYFTKKMNATLLQKDPLPNLVQLSKMVGHFTLDI